MIFHENCLLADGSHVIYLFLSKIGEMWQNLSSAAVVIGALRVKQFAFQKPIKSVFCFSLDFSQIC